MSTKRVPRVHKAIFSCTNIELPKAVKQKSSTDKHNSGITIKIFNGNGALGTLFIGQGGFTWKKKKARSLNWTEVCDMLDNRLENRQGR